MGVFGPIDREIQIAEVVFNARLQAFITCLFVMEACRRILDQRAIEIVFAIFWGSEPSKNETAFKVEPPFEKVILTSINQRLRFIIIVESVL